MELNPPENNKPSENKPEPEISKNTLFNMPNKDSEVFTPEEDRRNLELCADTKKEIGSISTEESKTPDIPPDATLLPETPYTTLHKVSTLFQFLLLGFFLLSLIGYWEAKRLEKIKWARGKIVWNQEFIKLLNEEILSNIDHRIVKVVPSVEIPDEKEKYDITSYLKKLEIADVENIPQIRFPAIVWLNNVNEFLSILESGRLPTLGKQEALAGDLTPSSNFFINGVEYKVVGKIRKECAPFVGCYVIPLENIEKIPENTVPGIAFPSFENLSENKDIANLFNQKKLDNSILYEISGIQSRTSPLFAYGAGLGLLIVCLSLRSLLRLYYYRLANPPTKILGQLFSEIYNRKKAFGVINTFLYLVFFAFLVYGLNEPENHRTIVYYINHVFSEGELSYIGEAYANKNILQAAITTFHNNFWVQTFLLTIVISIPPFMLGVLKTLISFAFAGFAMAPLWSDTATKLTFHSVTVGLELEAYILAVFGVVVWTYYFWNGVITRKNFIEKIKRGMKTLIGASIASGTLLAISALYEALTLIILLI